MKINQQNENLQEPAELDLTDLEEMIEIAEEEIDDIQLVNVWGGVTNFKIWLNYSIILEYP